MATLGISAHRLRHPLRAWAVQAGPRRRLAGRAARGLAGLRQPLGVRASRIGLPDPPLRPDPRGAGCRRAARPGLGGRAARAGRGLRHAGGGLGRPARQHAAPVVGAERQPDRSRGLQPRRLHARGAGAGAVAEHQPGALPERRDRGRPGAAPEAGVFLHLGQPAGHPAAPSVLPPRPALAAREGGDPAQRHPSVDRRARADAAPGRRARDGVGRRPGPSPAARSTTPTTR